MWWLCAAPVPIVDAFPVEDPSLDPGKKPIIYSQHFPTSCLLLPSLRLFIVNTVSPMCVIFCFSVNGACSYIGTAEIVLRLES